MKLLLGHENWKTLIHFGMNEGNLVHFSQENWLHVDHGSHTSLVNIDLRLSISSSTRARASFDRLDCLGESCRENSWNCKTLGIFGIATFQQSWKLYFPLVDSNFTFVLCLFFFFSSSSLKLPSSPWQVPPVRSPQRCPAVRFESWPQRTTSPTKTSRTRSQDGF